MFVYGAKENNLKDVNVQTIDKGIVTIVGRSGSGKSTLIYEIFGAELERRSLINKDGEYYYNNFHRKNFNYLSDEISNVQYLSQKKNQAIESSSVFTFSGLADTVRKFWIRESIIECPSCKKPIFENNLEAVKKYLEKNNINNFFTLDKNGDYYFDVDDYQITKKKYGSKKYSKINIDSVDDKNFQSCVFSTDKEVHNLDHELICGYCENITLKKHKSLLIKSFDSPFSGKCEACNGDGRVAKLNENSLLNEDKSVLDSINIPFDGKYYKYIYLSKSSLKKFLKKEDILDSIKLGELEENKKYLFKEYLYAKIISLKNKSLINYIKYSDCDKCNGTGFNSSARALKIKNINIYDIESNDILFLEKTIKVFYPNETQLINYINFFKDISLEQYRLSTPLTELSNGEKQRLRILKSITLDTTQQMMVLDEPSSGLHPYNIFQLISVIQKASIDNLVVMSEHSQLLVNNSDQIIELGSKDNGNESIVLSNNKVVSSSYRNSLFNKNKDIKYNHIHINDININNVKNQSIFLAENAINVLTGVSGSGKTSILTAINYYLDNQTLGTKSTKDLEYIYLDSEPMSQSKTSTLATFLNINDYIRDFFNKKFKSNQKIKKSWFSKNTVEGKCNFCFGTGIINNKICSFCNGEATNPKVQLLRINHNNIYDILNIPIYKIKELDILNIYNKYPMEIDNLIDFQLGHLSLGRSVKTLSGGESQRLKLSKFLSSNISSDNLIVIMDEPTVGLGKKEILVLMDKLSLYQLHHKTTLLLVEHNPYVISQANNVIEVGPYSGILGGKITFNGSFNDYLLSKNTHVDLLNREYFVKTEEYISIDDESLSNLLIMSDADKSYFYNKYFLQLKLYFDSISIEKPTGYIFNNSIDNIPEDDCLINPFINAIYHFQKVPIEYINKIIDILLFIGVDKYYLLAKDNIISKANNIREINNNNNLFNIWIDVGRDKNTIKQLAGGVFFSKSKNKIITNRVFDHLKDDTVSPQLTDAESITLSNFICKMCDLHKYVSSYAALERIRENLSGKLIENKLVLDLIPSNLLKFKIKPIFKYFQEQNIFDFDKALSEYSKKDFDYILYGCTDRFYPTKSLLKRDSIVWRGLVFYVECNDDVSKKACPQCKGIGFNRSIKYIKSNNLYFDSFIKTSANI